MLTTFKIFNNCIRITHQVSITTSIITLHTTIHTTIFLNQFSSYNNLWQYIFVCTKEIFNTHIKYLFFKYNYNYCEVSIFTKMVIVYRTIGLNAYFKDFLCIIMILSDLTYKQIATYLKILQRLQKFSARNDYCPFGNKSDA